MQMKNIRKLALFIIVLSITVNGIWCIWDYLSLLRVRSFGDALAHILVFGGGISLCFIPILGIWMGWSGLWNVVNAGGQDWDRSVGYENRWWRCPYYNYKFILMCFSTVS